MSQHLINQRQLPHIHVLHEPVGCTHTHEHTQAHTHIECKTHNKTITVQLLFIFIFLGGNSNCNRNLTGFINLFVLLDFQFRFI